MKFSSSAAAPRGGMWTREQGKRGRLLRAKVQSGAELLCKSANVGYESMEFRVSSMGAAARARGPEGETLEASRLRGAGPGKWSSEGESNPHHPVRSRAFCPLNYLTISKGYSGRDLNP